MKLLPALPVGWAAALAAAWLVEIVRLPDRDESAIGVMQERIALAAMWRGIP